MKKLFLSLMMIASYSFCNQVFAQDEMQSITLSLGESRGSFFFNKDRTLSFKGKVIQRMVFDKSVEQICISKHYVNKRFIICLTNDDLQSKGYLIDCFDLIGKLIKMDGPPMIWSSFSPDSSIVLMASYYESDMMLYSIQLTSFIVQKISIPINVKKTKDGFPLEDISYNLDEIKWIGNSTIELTADIKCNPYNDDNCDDQKRLIALRSYIIKYDILNNKTFIHNK